MRLLYEMKMTKPWDVAKVHDMGLWSVQMAVTGHVDPCRDLVDMFLRDGLG